MLDSLFFSVLGIAALMTVLTAFDRDEIAWPVLGFVTWIVCAVTVANVDISYAFLNSTDTVVEHTVTYHGGAFMILLFLGFAVVFIAVFFNRVLAAYRETITKK